MKYTFTLMNERDAREIQTWQYQEPYTMYSLAPASKEDLAEMLDQRSPYYAVRNELGDLLGFFNFGTSAQPWHSPIPSLYSEGRMITLGLGIRPDLTGKGLGLAFVNAGMTFAKDHFTPHGFRLFVLSFNERAICVYNRAGFTQVCIFSRQNNHGELTFIEMSRQA